MEIVQLACKAFLEALLATFLTCFLFLSVLSYWIFQTNQQAIILYILCALEVIHRYTQLIEACVWISHCWTSILMSVSDLAYSSIAVIYTINPKWRTVRETMLIFACLASHQSESTWLVRGSHWVTWWTRVSVQIVHGFPAPSCPPIRIFRWWKRTCRSVFLPKAFCASPAIDILQLALILADTMLTVYFGSFCSTCRTMYMIRCCRSLLPSCAA